MSIGDVLGVEDLATVVGLEMGRAVFKVIDVGKREGASDREKRGSDKGGFAGERPRSGRFVVLFLVIRCGVLDSLRGVSTGAGRFWGRPEALLRSLSTSVWRLSRRSAVSAAC